MIALLLAGMTGSARGVWSKQQAVSDAKDKPDVLIILFDVGEDTASPVDPYDAPFAFTCQLERLELRSAAPSQTLNRWATF